MSTSVTAYLRRWLSNNNFEGSISSNLISSIKDNCFPRLGQCWVYVRCVGFTYASSLPSLTIHLSQRFAQQRPMRHRLDLVFGGRRLLARVSLAAAGSHAAAVAAVAAASASTGTPWWIQSATAISAAAAFVAASTTNAASASTGPAWWISFATAIAATAATSATFPAAKPAATEAAVAAT
jgi:hypothetical protein